MLPSQCHRGSLPDGRYLLAPLAGNKEGTKEFVVLLLKRTVNRFPTNVLIPRWAAPLYFLDQVCVALGTAVVAVVV